MGDQPTVRPAEADDAERIRDVVNSSMTADYALSPEEIETIVETEFSADAQADRFGSDDTVALVAEIDGEGDDGPVLAGVVEATTEGDEGTVRWLHVDPERRGRGVGSTLFERARSELEEGGADDVRASTLAANTSSGAFFERFDFEKIDERETDIGGEEIVEYVFGERAEPADDDETGDAEGIQSTGGGLDEEVEADEGDGDAGEFPDTVTADGEEVYVGDEPFRGTEGQFVQTYVDPDRTERFGYYCLNCESTNVQMDSMERVECGNCGNTRKPDDEYDGSYL